MIIKDSMVLIHLAKLTVLEKSCAYFKEVIIPDLVFREVLKGIESGLEDAVLINNLIENKKIKIIKVENKNLIKKANSFNVQRGEAEALALYWGKNAKLLATDDDNLRKKRDLLNVVIIGTPAIIIKFYKEGIIDKDKTRQCIARLKEIGWFHAAVLDKMLMEVENEQGNWYKA